MTLLRAAGLSLAFGSRTLFHDLTLTLEAGERVGLIGVNGSGKSTLMKVLARALPPDTGELQLRRNARVTYLPQEPEFPSEATVASELSVAQAPLREALEAHHALSHALADHADDKRLAELAALGDRIEHLGGWDTEYRAKQLLDRLGVKDWDRPIRELSGGVKKRVAVARALLTQPDLLMLDEPTNHLDADTVEWLEDELDRFEGSLLLVTHDRYFLDGLVDRIVEIQPGAGVTSYPGNYEAYLEQKLIEAEENEAKSHKRARWITQEVAWLRKGVEARRTKSRARIERARKLMAERLPQRAKAVALQLADAPRLGHTVIEAKKVSLAYGERRVLDGASVILQGGERVGIVGRNGVGKTSFLRVLLGEQKPDGGEVVIGKNTRIAYYDQQRAGLDPELSVYDAAGGEEWVELGDKRIALRDYLDDLLFPVPMQKMKVKALSGGERNRLLLARLFLEGANVLVLDEPTNDLDLVTLNVLEGLLLSFQGTVLLVTHDRYFLDKVATRILAFEGDGEVVDYPGNFEMYRRLKEKAQAAAAPDKAAPAKPAPAPPVASPAPARKPGKLSYKDQRELDGMEAAIEAAEAHKATLEAALADPAVFSDAPRLQSLTAELEAATAAVDRLYARWQALQDLVPG
jgi:ATP-binding cassette subfamily F protein uup